MRFDVQRLRANTTLSDPDAFRYSRESAAPTPPLLYQGKRVGWWVTRPVPAALGLMGLGLGAAFCLSVYFAPPPKSAVVAKNLERMQSEIEAYENFLKNS